MKTYQDEPSNIKQLQEFCIYKKEKVVEKTLSAKSIFIYDTCSVIHHANLQNVESLSKLIKHSEGIVLITKTVLVELSSSENDGNILDKNIMFFKRLNELAIEIVLFKEEFCYDCLKFAYEYTISDINQLLKYSIFFIKSLQGATAQFVDGLKLEDKKTFLEGKSKREEITHFFSEIRKKKVTQDSMAEELIFIMIILLQGITQKIFFISDDFKSSDKFLKMIEYIKKHYNRKQIYMYTTATLFYKLVHEDLINKDDGRKLLECTYKNKIKMYASEKEDVQIEKKEYSIDEFMRIMSEDSEFRIYR